jgi:hypothetical protein
VKSMRSIWSKLRMTARRGLKGGVDVDIVMFFGVVYVARCFLTGPLEDLLGNAWN